MLTCNPGAPLMLLILGLCGGSLPSHAADDTLSAPLVMNLRTIEGNEAVHAAGSRSGIPITLQVSDSTGRAAAGVAVTFLMPADGPAGVFASGLSTEVLTSGKDGRVTLKGIRWGRESGRVRIRVTAMKDRSRAGTIVTQYVQARDENSIERGRPAVSVSKPKGKWLAIAVIAAGAAAGGLALGLSGGSSGSNTPATTTGAITTPGVQVGTPSITIGQP
jgi:hypothetical protein